MAKITNTLTRLHKIAERAAPRTASTAASSCSGATPCWMASATC
jgi:hypothetical protein